MSKKILILTNSDYGLYQFRNELIEQLTQNNMVTICSPEGTYKRHFTDLGCEYVPIMFNRHGTNPIKELQLLNSYKALIRRVKPDIVFTYTIKPNVYGGMACGALKVSYVANITGLGTAVENSGPLQKLTLFLYKLGLRNAQKVFFQNAENLDFMLKRGIVKGEYDLLPGSGVNPQEHRFKEYPKNGNHLMFLFIGRLMRDKGIEELVQAAKRLRKKYDNLHFIVVGGCEDDYKERLKTLGVEQIEMVGFQSDVDSFIQKAHALIHPSYHEGMSNVCLEAAACGRPILASDIPGCRETFDEGISGFGFKPRNVDSLCGAIEKFIALPYEKKAEMGRAGRAKMEREFDRNIVVAKYLKTIDEIGGTKENVAVPEAVG